MVVYKHSFPNCYVYIGISEDIDNRWKNGEGYISNVNMYNAIKKYGWQNIKHEILFTDLSLNTALEVEKSLIKQYPLNYNTKGKKVAKKQCCLLLTEDIWIKANLKAMQNGIKKFSNLVDELLEKWIDDDIEIKHNKLNQMSLFSEREEEEN